MESFLIKGGVPLRGTVEISGSKNAALPIMAATLLTGEPCVIRRVPDLSDTRFMAQILASLGAEVKFENGTLTIHARSVAAGAGVAARRLHHRRATDQSAPERFRGAGRKNSNCRRLH